MSTDRRTSASTASAVGYLLLLLAFATLGLFVAALATGTASAAEVFGVGLIACLGGSVAGFRAASRRLSESGVFIEATSPVSIFSAPFVNSRSTPISTAIAPILGRPSCQ